MKGIHSVVGIIISYVCMYIYKHLGVIGGSRVSGLRLLLQSRHFCEVKLVWRLQADGGGAGSRGGKREPGAGAGVLLRVGGGGERDKWTVGGVSTH